MLTLNVVCDRLTEEETILFWRAEELRRAGYAARAVIELAKRPDIDLHRATALLERGCPSETALRILL
jgi:hypothetical protein